VQLITLFFYLVDRRPTLFFFFTVECRGGEDLVVGFLVRPCLVQFKNSVMFVDLLEIITSTKPLYAGGDFFTGGFN